MQITKKQFNIWEKEMYEYKKEQLTLWQAWDKYIRDKLFKEMDNAKKPKDQR